MEEKELFEKFKQFEDFSKKSLDRKRNRKQNWILGLMVFGVVMLIALFIQGVGLMELGQGNREAIWSLIGLFPK
jgi:hypothetical protein